MDDIKNTKKITLPTSIESFRLEEEWINSLGINFKKTRFGNAKRIHEKWSETGEVPSHEELWCLCELMDLKEFYKFFSSEKVDKVFISKMLSGSNFLSDETKTQARDYLFEFKVASRFKRSGFEIIENNDHDVVVEKGDHKFYIECKRFINFKKMSERIKYAFNKQLSSIENVKEHGVIFLDFSRVLYKNFIKENSQPFTTKEILTEWRDSNDSMLKKMLEKQHNDIISGVKDCVLYYSFPVIIEGAGFVKFNHFFTLTSDQSESTDLILKSFRESVGNI